MRKIIVNCDTRNLDEYKKLAEHSKEIGATHVNISQVEHSMWQWDLDRTDPYPNWGMTQATIFKIMVPDALKSYIPEDYAKRNLETIAKRAEILKQYDLKASFTATEPGWLPEQVFMDHPSWRGPRTDQVRRARTEYYSPCTDNPEVQELYIESVYKLCKIIPIEFFRFLTNDSGGGICWSERLYPGANGPRACKHISVADRAVNFLSTIQKGAAKAGIKAEVGYIKNFADNEKPAIASKLKDGQYCYDYTNKGTQRTKHIGYIYFTDTTYPVEGIPVVTKVANEMMNVVEDKKSNVFINLPSVDVKPVFEFLKQSKTMKNSTFSKYETLRKTAISLIGKKYADKLLDIWDCIGKTQELMSVWNAGGFINELGTVHQRWLTRPLVAKQSELTEEEKSYYRPFLFQAGTEEEAENLVNMQATIWLGGDQSRRHFNWSVGRVKNHVKKAVSIIEELLSKDDIGEYAEELKELKLKLKMYVCVLSNASNVIAFQSILDRTNFEETTEDKTIVNDEQGDPRWFKIKAVIRDEIDNCYEMIDLIDQAKTPLLVCVDKPEKEFIKRFGPNVRENLVKKIEIMRKHSHEFDLLYRSYNL